MTYPILNVPVANPSRPTAASIKILAALVALIFVLAACAIPPAGATSYIASIDGAPASARVGIVVEDGIFKAYICSLDDAFNLTSARWYEGVVDADGNIAGVSADGVALQGSVRDGQFSGTIVNIDNVTMTFSGAEVAELDPAGLYRGTGEYNGQAVIVGATIAPDGTFAATAQYQDRFEFIAPIGAEPVFLSDGTLGILLGPDGAQIEVTLVTTLQAE